MTTAPAAVPDCVPPDIQCAQDYEAGAAQRIAAPTFAYIAGGSGDDRTLRANRAAFDNWAAVPRILRDMTGAETKVCLPGGSLQHPILLAPVALQQLVHADAEAATARGAAAVDACLVTSTLSSLTLEDIARAGNGPRWFQLYLQPTRAATLELLRRAQQAGYGALVVTLDAALQQPSRSALAGGFRMPSWIHPGNLMPPAAAPPAGAGVFDTFTRNAVSRDDLAWLLRTTSLPVWIKGVLHADDARALQAMGVAGIVVSNHGGRSLDGVPASLDRLPGIRDAVGDEFPVLCDGGIRSGSDVFKAIALGADAVLVGRLQVYALAVAGALGVAHMVRLLHEELALQMAMTGCRCLADVRAASLQRNPWHGS